MPPAVPSFNPLVAETWGEDPEGWAEKARLAEMYSRDTVKNDVTVQDRER